MKPKVCLTASATLIHDGKVLLVKHKKLKQWLCPGGHIEGNELPHQAAEREFLEETGIKVQVYSSLFQPRSIENDDLFHPIPFVVNEHWVCRENYDLRLNSFKNKSEFMPNLLWQKGCEKHLNFAYLAKLNGSLEINPAEGESTEIAWFSLEDLYRKYKAELASSILKEIELAFSLAK